MKTRIILHVSLFAGAISIVGAQTNTVTGTDAGSSITSGKQDSAFGFGALKKNTTGKLNTAVGSKAMLKNQDGSFNTAIGSGALKKNTGSSNVAMGFEALFKNKDGQFNVAIGDGAMKFNVSGNNNVALGMDAGSLTDGNDNILIDHVGVAGESGAIRIGTAGTHSKTFIAGKISGDGSGLTGVNAATLSGQISGNQISPATVTTTQLAPAAVTTAKIAPAAVTSTHLAPNLNLSGNVVASGTGTFSNGTAVGASETLRLIRGRIDTGGSIFQGSGFSVTSNGTGTCTVTFDVAFSEQPTPVACSFDSSTPEIVTISSLSSASFQIKVWDTGGSLRGSNVQFVVTGN